MYTKYFSDDGKEFNNKSECEQYEREQKLNALENPFIWDKDGKVTDDLERAYYMKAENTAQAEAIYLKSRYFGIAYPEDIYTEDEDTSEKTFNTGSWYYSDYDCEWHSITERVEELKKEILKLEKYL